MNKTNDLLDKNFTGLCFVNLVDFDALWGHRRNPVGYAKEIENFDKQLKTTIEKLRYDDLLILTADHGNDPCAPGTDHTREMVPLLMYSKSLNGSGLLNVTDSFATIGATIAENFNVQMPIIGNSVLKDLI